MGAVVLGGLSLVGIGVLYVLGHESVDAG